jgi:hypothetical protein
VTLRIEARQWEPFAQVCGLIARIFNPNVLSNPRKNCQLTYRLEGQEIVAEKQPGVLWVTVDVTALS